MSKLTLTFDIPEERGEANIAVHAGSLSGFIWDFEQWLRSKRKYTEETEINLEDLWDAWHRMKSERLPDLDIF